MIKLRNFNIQLYKYFLTCCLIFDFAFALPKKKEKVAYIVYRYRFQKIPLSKQQYIDNELKARWGHC